MFPIVSIANLITVPFLLLISFSLFVSFWQTKNKNIGYFFAGMLSVTLMGGILAFPGLVFKDLTQIATVFAFYPFLIFVGLGFWGAIPFNISGKKNFEIIFLVALVAVAIITTAINLNNVSPAVTYEYPPFIYWEDTRGPVINIFMGALSGAILIYLVLFFFLSGLKSSDNYVKTRSSLIARGLAVFFLAAIINFIVGASYTPHKYISSSVASLLIILSSIIVFIGVRHKRKEEEEYPEIQW